MNLIPFPKPELQLLQELVDLAVDDVFADYDESGRAPTRAIAVLDDKTRHSIDLGFLGRITQLGTARDHGFSAINAAGAQRGAVVVRILQQDSEGQDREVVFIFVRSGDASGVCALLLNRQTGDSTRDFALVTEITNFDGFLEPSLWGGPRCKIDIGLTAEILKFQPRPKPGA